LEFSGTDSPNEGDWAEWQKRHNGDAHLGKALLFSIGSQSVSNSKGTHVQASEDGGYSKSDGIKQMGILVPPPYWKNGNQRDCCPIQREHLMALLWSQPQTTFLVMRTCNKRKRAAKLTGIFMT
jgi:hypothetical protein